MESVPLPLANPQIPIQASDCSQAIHRAPAERLDAPAPLRLWHLTSLDAPTVAVVWSLAFAWAAGAHLPLWAPVLLALGTWSVYIGDRTLDAHSALRAGNTEALRDRHFFHWRHRRALLPVAAIAAAAAACIIFKLMPALVRERDSIVGAAALAYFSGVHAPRRPRWIAPLLTKEFFVGTIFTAGCIVPALTRCAAAALWPTLLTAGFFAAVAWLNCHAIERWESGAPQRIQRAGVVIASAGLLLALVLAPSHVRSAWLVVAASLAALLLALLDRRRQRLTPMALRACADLVLLTPLVLLMR